MPCLVSILSVCLTPVALELTDEIKQRYIHKAAQVNEQRARARASRLKRKKETTVHTADEAAKAHMVDLMGEGTLDADAYSQLQRTLAASRQGPPMPKVTKVATLTTAERLEVTYSDGTPCIMHQDLVFRICASFGPKLL